MRGLYTTTNLLLFLNVLTLGTIFRVRSYPAPEADFQTYLKLGVWAVSLGLAALLWRAWLMRSFRLDNVFMTLFVMCCCVSALFAPLVYFSIGAAFSVLCVMAFVAVATSILSDQDVYRTIFAALSVLCFASIIVYYVNPEFGRLAEWHGGSQIIGNRMSGVTGTANALGAISAFGLFVGFHVLRSGYARSRALCLVLLAIDAYALVMTNSRTSMLGLLVGLAVVSLIKPSIGKYALFAFAFCSLGVALFIGLLVDPESIATTVSRSGDVEEITTGTGRTAIWGVTLDLIERNFLFGYGFASGPQIFDQYQHEVGFKVASAHNMVLQIFLNTGFVGFMLFMLAVLLKMYTALLNQSGFIVGAFAFLMVLGLSESVAVQGTANVSTLIMALIFAARYKDGERRT
jgi:exopolysaccharide production protein ExoQ